jgi:hypothetical protein
MTSCFSPNLRNSEEAPVLNTAQLCLLRCLNRPFGLELLEIFLNRNGATVEDLAELERLGLVRRTGLNLERTEEGTRVYNRERKGRFF